MPRTGAATAAGCATPPCQRDGRRQRRAARPQDGLRGRGHHRRPLCRLRNPGGPGKRHAAGQDQGSGHRRQPVRRTHSRRQEGRHRHLDHARSGRHAGRSQIDRQHARRSRPRRRPQGRPEATHPDGARRSRCRPAAAALPRDRRQRFHRRSGGRAVRPRQIRRRRRPEHEHHHRDRRQQRRRR